MPTAPPPAPPAPPSTTPSTAPPTAPATCSTLVALVSLTQHSLHARRAPRAPLGSGHGPRHLQGPLPGRGGPDGHGAVLGRRARAGCRRAAPDGDPPGRGHPAAH